MKRLIRFSVNHPISVIMFLISFVICGCISCFFIHIDYLPKIQDRFLLITAQYDGIAAEQMKKLVTTQIEDSAASIKGIKNITSVTRDGISLIQVELHWNTDVDLALTESQQLIDQCYEILPAGCSKPNVRIFNPYNKETIKLAIIPTDNNLEYGRYITKNDFKPRFQRIEGVSNVMICGGDTAEIQIIPDKIKLESFGLDLSAIAQLVMTSNFEYPAGNILEGNKKYIFKTDGLIKSIEDFENIPLTLNKDLFIKLGDIASIKSGIEDKQSFFTYMGKECICIDILKKSDASPISVSKRTKKITSELNELYGKDFDFIILQDLSEQLIDSIMQLSLALVFGVAITTIILFVFFRKIKISLLVASIMPLTILSAVIILCILNRSINIISISGIAIGIGMVIDSSIVLVENSIKKLSLKNTTDTKYVVYKSTEEVYLSSVGSTLTTLVVFIPFFFLPGITGKLFTDLAIAVMASIGFSCILSLTFVPAVLVIVFNKKYVSDCKLTIISKGESLYESVLRYILRKKKFIPAILGMILVSCCIFVKLLPVEIMPSTYNSYISVELLFDENSSYEYLVENEKYLNSYLCNNNNFEWYTISGGIDKDSYERYIRPDIRNECLLVNCKVHDVSKAVDFFELILSDKDIEYKIESGKNILNQILETNPRSFIICGSSTEELQSNLIKRGINDFYPNSIVSEYVFEPDRKLCARFNVSSGRTAEVQKELLEGVDAGYFYQNGKKIPIKVKYEKNVISNAKQLTESLISVTGYSIPVSAVGNFDYKKCEKVFYRYNRKEAKITESDELVNVKDKDILNPNKENLNELILNGIFLLLIVLILLYCVMGAQFESFKIPFFMMVSIPPAFAGAFILLFLCRQTMNINTIIALVILFGTAVNNSIILYESLQNEIVDDKIIIKRSVEKFRSIFITTLTTVCALIPFAIDPYHKNAQSSLSIAIIGGLIFSFFIVLSVVPVILSVFIKKEP